MQINRRLRTRTIVWNAALIAIASNAGAGLLAQQIQDVQRDESQNAETPAPVILDPVPEDPAGIQKYFETHPLERVEGHPASSQTLAAQAESAAGTVSFNGFVSVQVNINAAGNNILGDAANEPSIAIDPTDPQRIVIGWRQFDTITNNFRQAGVAYSHDGGTTWTFPGVIDPGQFRSDPVLAVDGAGAFYYSSLSSLSSIEVFKSLDGGITWGTPAAAFGGDKQWMVVDTRTTGVGAGHIYQNWNIQFTCCVPNDFTRSIDGGATFGSLTQISPPSLKWGTMDVGPDGTLYVVGSDLNRNNGHLFTKSLSALDPLSSPLFETPTSIQLGGTTDFGSGFSSPNPAGLLGQTWIAAHPTQLGELYVLGSVRVPSAPPLEIMFIRSSDDGNTWSTPIRISDDAIGAGNWQWFGTLSVAPNGRIDAVWNDTRVSGVANMSALFYSFSTDGGLTWTANQQVSQTFNSHLSFPQQNKIGDYYGMISDDDGASVAYSATFNGEQDLYFLRIPRDCNGNGVVDGCDIACGAPGTVCDVAGCGTSNDCNFNAIPDDCEPQDDCNGNGTLDICEIASDPSLDCNMNGLLDICENPADCNANGQLDLCEIVLGTASDCNQNGQLDECEITANPGIDSDHDGIPDDCEGACCDCSGCQLKTPLQCAGASIEFSGLGTFCGAAGACVPLPPVGNDTCAMAESLASVSDILLAFDNRCAADNDPQPVACPSDQPFGADLWYTFVAPASGTVRISTCDDTNFDAILAVYGGTSATCVCPLDGTTLLACGDDTCGAGGGPAFVTIQAVAGRCYTIRVGGWFESIGLGSLRVSYLPPSAPTPPVPDAIGSHLPKNRFVSFALSDLPAGQTTAIRVELVTLHDTTAPPNAPDFSAFEGQFRYVNLIRDDNGNEVTTCPDSPSFNTSFRCATLGCAPEYREWDALAGGNVLHVTGDAIAPSSLYRVALLGGACAGNESLCSAVSTPLEVATARWGDVGGGFTVNDVTLMVDKLKQLPGAISEPAALLHPAVPRPDKRSVNVLEISLTVDALKNFPYPFAISACP